MVSSHGLTMSDGSWLTGRLGCTRLWLTVRFWSVFHGKSCSRYDLKWIRPNRFGIWKSQTFFLFSGSRSDFHFFWPFLELNSPCNQFERTNNEDFQRKWHWLRHMQLISSLIFLSETEDQVLLEALFIAARLILFLMVHLNIFLHCRTIGFLISCWSLSDCFDD